MCMAKQMINQHLFLLLGLLLTYPLISDIFWWGWSFVTSLEVLLLVLLFCSHLCFVQMSVPESFSRPAGPKRSALAQPTMKNNLK